MSASPGAQAALLHLRWRLPVRSLTREATDGS